MTDPAVTAVMTVQCGLDWLRPGSAALRDAIDETVTELALNHGDVRIDRIVLHSLPAVTDMSPAELAALRHSGRPSDSLCHFRRTSFAPPIDRRELVREGQGGERRAWSTRRDRKWPQRGPGDPCRHGWSRCSREPSRPGHQTTPG